VKFENHCCVWCKEELEKVVWFDCPVMPRPFYTWYTHACLFDRSN
jgi:hypothetical protein